MGILGGGTQPSRSTGGLLGRQKREEEERKQRQAAAVRSAAPELFDPLKQVEAARTGAAFKPVLPTALPSVEQQLRTATTAFKPTRPQVSEPERYDPLNLYDKPVIGPILRGVEQFQQFTEPAAKVAQQFYTPGAAPAAVSGLYGAARAGLSRLAPSIGLGQGLGQKVAREAITEAVTGAPLAAGQALAQDPGISGREFAQQTALGAGLGAVAGPIGPLLGRGIQMARGAAGDVLGGQLRAAEAIEQVGRQGDQVTAATQRLADIDEQIASLNVRTDRGGSFANEAQSLMNDRNQTIDFIRRNDPEFTAPESPVISPAAEVPQLPSQLTAPVPGPRTAPIGERAFFSTLEEGGLTPEVQARMSASEKRGYEQITNVETVNSANARIERLGVDRAEAQLLGKTKFKPDDVATGMRLIQQLQGAGQVERAVSIAEKVAKQLTEAGQTVQAASIWARLSPEGALLAAQRKVTRINENLLRGQAEVKLSPAQAQEITDAAGTIQAAGGSRERAGTVMEIMDRVNKGETITPQERQLVADFVTDAKRFLKPADTRPPRPAKAPKEMDDVRVRDRVVSFLAEKEQEALARINARRNRLSSTPLDEWADYAIVLASRMAGGTVKVADLTESLVRDFGEGVRPHFNNIYAKAKEIIGQSSKQINDQVISKAERVAEGFIKQKGDELAPDDVDFIRNMAQRVSSLSDQERRIAGQDLQAIMQGFEKVGVGRKIASAQYIAMLLNPLTQIRNVVGNEMMYRLERMAKLIGTPIDIAASKITKGPRTVTFKSGPAVWDDFFKPMKDYWGSLPEGARSGWRGVSPEGLTTKYEIQGQAFRSKYNPLTYMEKALGASLQGFDYAAYTRATNQTMSEMAYLDALNKGIQGDDAIRNHMQTYMTNLDDATHNIAKDYGKFVTLQDDSTFAKGIMGFRRFVNKFTGSPEFGAGSLILPFAKTPANLLMRALDYSPAGIIKALKQTHDVLRKPNTDLTRADVITSVTRAILGTGVGATAYWLADKGALFGRSSKDPEVRKLMQGTGIKDFQINGSALTRMLGSVATGGDVDQAAKLQPGDTLWGYEWAQPASMPMAIGSNIYQGVQEKAGVLQTAVDATAAGATTLLDSSVLSGIRETFQIPPGEDDAVKAIIMNLLKRTPSQFVPSLARQFNTLFDERLRETYAMPGDPLGKITGYAQSQLPGLAQQMPQRVSTLGDPQTRLNTFVDVFLSPAARSKYEPTPEAQLVIDLLNETGDKRLAPRAVAKYLSGKDIATGEQRRVDLTPEQFVELQTIVGQETANRLKNINPELPTDRKIEMVIDALDKAGKIGKNKLKQDVGLRRTR